jgi:four helix bundle protein
MRDHKKLKVFHLADRLALGIYASTRSFPREEKFGLTSQLRRAAVSVGANIVEAASRRSTADYARILGIAYGSARELEYELSIAARLGYLNANEAGNLLDLADQTGRALRALVLAVQPRA